MDTIQIRISGKDKFKVASWAQFNHDFSIRSFSELSEKERIRARDKRLPYVRHFVLHPNLGDEFYMPSIEIFENVDVPTSKVDYDLIIRLSVPKFLYENSLQEVAPGDKVKALRLLSERLAKGGIQVSEYMLHGGVVSVIHFCKNILLPPEIKFRSLLDELCGVDVGKAYDTTEETGWRNTNGSEIVRLRCGTREWIFYDKIEEMQKPKHKGGDLKKTPFEKDMLDVCDLRGRSVFRYEYRLNKGQTIRSEVNAALGRPYTTSVIFADLFSEKLWKDILLKSWKRILKRPENQLALIGSNEELDLLLYVLTEAQKRDKSGHSLNQALWSYGLAVAIKKRGAKTVRQEIAKIWSKKSSERLDDKLATAADLLQNLPLSDGIVYLGQELERFERFTLGMLGDEVQ